IGGGSERVRVVDKIVVGGAGKGITPGDDLPLPQQPGVQAITLPGEARIPGGVGGPGGKTIAAPGTPTPPPPRKARKSATDNRGTFVTGLPAGKYAVDATAAGLALDKVTLTRRSDRIYQLDIAMAAAAPPPDPRTLGFLYQLAITGNSISAMGMSGIGLPRLSATIAASLGKLAPVQSVRARLGNPVVGLDIRRNRIVACLQNPFDSALLAEAAVHGLGGISLGLCEDVAIVENRIEGNGTGAVNPTCGVFVGYGEGIDIGANRILGN